MYLWIGPESNELEQKMSCEVLIQMVQVFAEYDLKGQRGNDPLNIPLIAVNAGSEPPGFSMWFHGWDFILAKEAATPDGSNPDNKSGFTKDLIAGIRSVYEIMGEYENQNTIFPYSELKRTHVGKPLPNDGKGIDASRLEQYLSEDEFEVLFQMNREQFYACPDWKKRKIKSQLKLY